MDLVYVNVFPPVLTTVEAYQRFCLNNPVASAAIQATYVTGQQRPTGQQQVQYRQPVLVPSGPTIAGIAQQPSDQCGQRSANRSTSSVNRSVAATSANSLPKTLSNSRGSQQQADKVDQCPLKQLTLLESVGRKRKATAGAPVTSSGASSTTSATVMNSAWSSALTVGHLESNHLRSQSQPMLPHQHFQHQHQQYIAQSSQQVFHPANGFAAPPPPWNTAFPGAGPAMQWEQSHQQTQSRTPLQPVQQSGDFEPPELKRRCSMPILRFERTEGEVWQLMCSKEKRYQAIKNPACLTLHRGVTSRMRSILLDWLREVSEVYKLHRETFHLACDYVDRYLSINVTLPKRELQLLGVTALFVAAKIEEIYPPKLREFAYVTDGACAEGSILKFEGLLLQTLKWCLQPVTGNSWLTCYFQILSHKGSSNSGAAIDDSNFNILTPPKQHFEKAEFNSHMFVRTAELVDLCLLHVESMKFPGSMLAATAIHHLFEPSHLAFDVSGYSESEMSECIGWMRPFALAMAEFPSGSFHNIPEGIPHNDRHNIQPHFWDLTVLDRVQELQNQAKQREALLQLPNFQSRPFLPVTNCEFSPTVSSLISPFLTPPSSGEMKK